MIGYDLLTKFRELTPKQQDQCIQFFMGSISMDYEGFHDSKNRPNYPHSAYSVNEFKMALAHARKQEMSKGQLDHSYNRYCLICGFNRLHRDSISEYCTNCGQSRGEIACDRRIAELEKIGVARQVWHEGKIISVWWPRDSSPQKEEPSPIRPSGMSEAKAMTSVVEYAEQVKELQKTKTTGECKLLQNEVQLFADGQVASSKCPHFHLIPTVALLRLAARFELGQQMKGDKAWNATTPNQEVLTDIPWIIERLSHIIDHALKLRDKLSKLKTDPEATMKSILEDDDAGAIAWGGCFLIAATDKLTNSSQLSEEKNNGNH